MRKIVFILAVLLFIPIVYSAYGGMPLLAIKQTSTGYEGSTAELFLEIKKGTGRVFVDTFPLSKIDTQFSMRAAKQIACDFLDYECDDYDFIYTIRANSPIIGGPSAGAPATILTISVLSNKPLKDGIALTGTINSGGLIGPVGGLKEKIKAGADIELNIILIPQGETETINDTSNISVSLKDYGSKLGVEVIEVPDINSALELFTGQSFKSFEEEITISKSYKVTMKRLALKLCDRNLELWNMTINVSSEIKTLYKQAVNLSEKSDNAFKHEEFYSAASFCFGSNVKFNQVFLEMKNFSDSQYELLLKKLMDKIKSFDKEIDKRKIKTITDLESYMVVKERLIEAMEYANTSKNISHTYSYAYANERVRSAYSWAEFFNHQGREFDFDDASLMDSCRQRIAEAEERLQYASIYLPFKLKSPREELDKAYKDFNNDNYALCLFKASKSKAESNIILNTMGIGTDFVPKLIENKLNAATRVIVKAEKKDIFPILGYSYYEYANNLKETDKFSSLLYAEYALEFSNLDVYFKEKKGLKLPRIDKSRVIILFIGIFAGIPIGALFKQKVKKRKYSQLRKKPNSN